MLDGMSERRISRGHALLAVLCLVPVLAGVALLLSGPDGASLGWALVGFFGAGAVVLGRQAFTTR
jgi:hypothetical protein